MANIKLNNNLYPIPDAVLAAHRADFVAHLGTIAGSGEKVVVGGVEYGVDASKVAGAFSELESVFGELSSGGGESDSNVITWDGNTEGRYIVDMGDGMTLVKVSDTFIPREQVIGGITTAINVNGSTDTGEITEAGLNAANLGFTDTASWGNVLQGVVGVSSAETIDVDGISCSFETGLYFVSIEGWMHISSLTLPSTSEIPSVITWDGNTNDGKFIVEAFMGSTLFAGFAKVYDTYIPFDTVKDGVIVLSYTSGIEPEERVLSEIESVSDLGFTDSNTWGAGGSGLLAVHTPETVNFGLGDLYFEEGLYFTYANEYHVSSLSLPEA